MTSLRIASWNINGIRARFENLTQWLSTEKPDILCLQETKIMDSQFPNQHFADMGYHIITKGQKSFNGVAIFSKKSPFETLDILPGDPDDSQARYLEACFEWSGQIIRVSSLYCPNGNPVQTEKYSYKHRWMSRLQQRIEQILTYEEPAIFIGDYNIIPQEIDAKNPNKWTEDALFLPESRAIYQRLLNLGLTDAVRSCTDDQIFTFWNYQARAWEKNDGIRIDHALLSPEAANRLLSAYPQKEPRNWEKPSDHVPIWVEIKL